MRPARCQSASRMRVVYIYIYIYEHTPPEHTGPRLSPIMVPGSFGLPCEASDDAYSCFRILHMILGVMVLLSGCISESFGRLWGYFLYIFRAFWPLAGLHSLSYENLLIAV